MKIFSEKSGTSSEYVQPSLTDEDLEDREDFQYLLSVMDRQGAIGITQPVDYKDAIQYKDRLADFYNRAIEGGSVTELFREIIFDFDGVLWDSMHLVYATIHLMIQKKANGVIPIPTLEEVAASFHAPYEDYYKRFGMFLNVPENVDAFRDPFRFIDTYEGKEEFLRDYREAKLQASIDTQKPAMLFPEAKAALDKIREAKRVHPNLKIHIISAGRESDIRNTLLKCGIAEDFDEIHGECHDKAAMIESIASKEGAKDKTVMVGDLPSDIKDAQRVEGVKTVAVARSAKERERLGMYLPDFIISDLNEIFALRPYNEQLRAEKGGTTVE